EGAVALRRVGGRARKEFGPGAESSPDRVDHYIEFAFVPSCVPEVGMTGGEHGEVVVTGGENAIRDVDGRVGEALCDAQQSASIAAVRTFFGLCEELGAIALIGSAILVGGDPLLEIAALSLERVDP